MVGPLLENLLLYFFFYSNASSRSFHIVTKSNIPIHANVQYAKNPQDNQAPTRLHMLL